MSNPKLPLAVEIAYKRAVESLAKNPPQETRQYLVNCCKLYPTYHLIFGDLIEALSTMEG